MVKITITSSSFLGDTGIKKFTSVPSTESTYKVISQSPYVVEITITELVYHKLITDILNRFRLKERRDYEVQIDE